MSGFVLCTVLAPFVLIGGASVMQSWRFWVFWVVFSFLVGGVLAALVCRFALHEEVLATARRWELFPNVSRRHRRFLLLNLTLLPAFIFIHHFAPSPPSWLVIAMSLVALPVGVLGCIGGWHVFFGERGIFTTWKSNGLEK